ncbi:hypothetical protein EW145_g2153 [Phellinidium pouzarii]|uniref:AAA-ATPase-like domain-containing protein n=1 Tax=Phellinidium pouzarii TaxID=167371 RepID=A0A4S4LC64_9AGAM|nr:hypothetical protein EW145_g2153 [Phellinidium pouzarii]
MDFSILRGASNKEEFEESFMIQLGAEVRRHKRLGHFKRVIDPDDLELINAITSHERHAKTKLETVYYKLSRILFESTDRKVLILVDEYDTPVSSAINQELYIYTERFLRRTFGTLLRKNRFVFGALLVGILKCMRTSFLSGIPSIKIYPLSPAQSLYGDTCLFTEEEVQALFNFVKVK